MMLRDEAATAAVGKWLGSRVRPGDVIALSGPLGVGKTALARAVIRSLGHVADVPSPSFAIVQPYEELDPPVWHVDLFRIEDAGEVGELGLEAADDAVLLVEWPERMADDSWPQALRLTLDFDQGGARRLTAVVPPSWQERWPPR
jgi:tRNA threonylcarbamoyladenosine biosynthesis protein TsaE